MKMPMTAGVTAEFEYTVLKGVESPAGVEATGHYRIEREGGPNHVNIPAKQVYFRKGQIFCANH